MENTTNENQISSPEKTVRVGLFWAFFDENSRQSVEHVEKFCSTIEANYAGFVHYPYNHAEMWEDICPPDEINNCALYPQGRVSFDVTHDRYVIYADKCVTRESIDEVIELFGIENYIVLYDDSYTCSYCEERIGKLPQELNYKILRGSDKIGANRIEITYKDTNILLELGKELGTDEQLNEFEKTSISMDYDAVVVSHYHSDHAGLVNEVYCPVYMGRATRRILRVIDEYNGKIPADNYTPYANCETFEVGKINVTPYLCDHSAFDSYMLLFEAGGKSILYTGDFRFHGRKSCEKLLEKLPKKVNTLIYEGTNVGRNVPQMTESELEEEGVKIMQGHTNKPVFVLQSTTNMDRLVSFYRASKKCGRRVFMDDYQSALAKAAGGKIPRPDVFNDVFAFTAKAIEGKRYDKFCSIKNRRSIDSICEDGNFTMFVRQSMLGYIKALSQRQDVTGGVLIYSLWQGYQKDEKMQAFLKEIEDLGITLRYLHTSGHAFEPDIERLKTTVKADRYIPVHTESNNADKRE
jgi:ribonuclease J